MLHKKKFFKILQNSQKKHTRYSFLVKGWSFFVKLVNDKKLLTISQKNSHLQYYQKRESDTGVFIVILQSSSEQLFHTTPPSDYFYKHSLHNSIEIIRGFLLFCFYPVWKYVSIRSFWSIKLDMEPVRMNFRTIGHTKNWFEAYPFLTWNKINKMVLRLVLQNNKLIQSSSLKGSFRP